MSLLAMAGLAGRLSSGLPHLAESPDVASCYRNSVWLRQVLCLPVFSSLAENWAPQTIISAFFVGVMDSKSHVTSQRLCLLCQERKVPPGPYPSQARRPRQDIYEA